MLVPQHVPHEVFGEWARFTLVYNPGRGVRLCTGPYSRLVFMLLTVVALLILSALSRDARRATRLRTSRSRSCAAARSAT